MDFTQEKAKLLHYKATAARLLGEPTKLRLAIIAALLGVALLGVYMPLSDGMQQQRQLLGAEKKRADAIHDVETLRKDVAEFRSRIGDKSDTNECIQYLLGGMRQAKVKLRDMASKEPQTVGPYKAISLAMELQGDYAQLRSFMEWLEQADRLLRVETVKMDRMPDTIMMKIYILILVRKDA
jgi:Tfp pilus assembly protein PilO